MSGCVWSANRLPHTEHDDCAGFMPHLARGLQRLMDRQAADCDHPGIEHGPWSYTGICPRCRKCKFIGHGPLCVDCYTGPHAAHLAAQRPTPTEES